MGSFFRGLFRFVKPLLYLGVLNKEPEQPVGAIFENRFSQAKGNFEEKIKNMAASVFALKWKRKSKKPQFRGKRRKAKDIFTEK
jgi:hypothetical protein